MESLREFGASGVIAWPAAGSGRSIRAVRSDSALRRFSAASAVAISPRASASERAGLRSIPAISTITQPSEC